MLFNSGTPGTRPEITTSPSSTTAGVFENLGNVRDMGNVGREIEFGIGIDEISLGRLAVGAAGPRDLNLQLSLRRF
jgi:hypothetical protein